MVPSGPCVPVSIYLISVLRFFFPHSASFYLSYQKLMILKICPVSVNSAPLSLVLVSTCPLEYHHIILLFLHDESP